MRRGRDVVRMQFLRNGRDEREGRPRGDGLIVERWRDWLAGIEEMSGAGGWRRSMRKR